MNLSVSPAIVASENSNTPVTASGSSFANADQPDTFITLLSNKLSQEAQSLLPEQDMVTNTLLVDALMMVDTPVDIRDSRGNETSSLLPVFNEEHFAADAVKTLMTNDTPASDNLRTFDALLDMLPYQTPLAALEQQQGKTALNLNTEQGAVTKIHPNPQFALEQIQEHKSAAVELQPVWLHTKSGNPLPVDTTSELAHLSQLLSDNTGQQVSGNASQEKMPLQPNNVVPLLVSAPTAESGALNTASTTAQLNAQLGSKEWQQTLGQQVVMFSRNGQQNAQLFLHPPELGILHVRLSMEDNLAQLHFASMHTQVRAAMEAAMPGLRHALAESGIQLGQSTVGSETTSPWQQARQDSGSSQHPAEIIAHQGERLSLTTPAALESLAAGRNAIDIFA